MPIGVLGLAFGLLSLVGFGVSLEQIIATGSWRDWTMFDWIVNIGLQLFLLFPIFKLVKLVGTTAALSAGWLARLASKIPLIGTIATWLWAGKTALKTFYELYMMKWFTKGGIFFELGSLAGFFLKLFKKHPILVFALVLLSSLADGVFSGIYQLWGDISIRAANAAFEAISKMMSEGGYGDPISETVAILSGSKSSLPPCFTSIWGAVGASECFGLVITTFQYMALLSSIRVGYRLYGKSGV